MRAILRIILMALSIVLSAWCAACAESGTGFWPSTVTPQANGTLTVKGFVQNGQVFDFKIEPTPSGEVIKTKTKVSACFEKAPDEQWPEVRYGHVNAKSPPSGYNQVLGWIIAMNDSTEPGKVEIKSLEVRAKDQNGRVVIVTDALECPNCIPEERYWGSRLPVFSWRDANAWALKKDHSNFLLFNGNSRMLEIPTGSYFGTVFHAWNAYWNEVQKCPDSAAICPRPLAYQDVKYAVRVVARVTGAARLQVGLDFYSSDPNKGIVEAAVSNWECAANGWVTLKAGAF